MFNKAEKAKKEETKEVLEMISKGYDDLNSDLEKYAGMLEEEYNKVSKEEEE